MPLPPPHLWLDYVQCSGTELQMTKHFFLNISMSGRGGDGL